MGVSKLKPAIDTHQIATIGAGLGCWIDDRTNGTWSVTSKSAKDRICMLMNHSFQEIDMFVLKQGHKDPQSNFPESFWIDELQKFIRGGGCDATYPKRTVCPNATIGPHSWTPGGDPHCCTSFSNRGKGEGAIQRARRRNALRLLACFGKRKTIRFIPTNAATANSSKILSL